MRKVVIAGLLLVMLPTGAKAADINGCDDLPAVEMYLKSKYDAIAVKKLQTCLRSGGFYTGKVDGLKGPLTLAALGNANKKLKNQAVNK